LRDDTARNLRAFLNDSAAGDLRRCAHSKGDLAAMHDTAEGDAPRERAAASSSDEEKKGERKGEKRETFFSDASSSSSAAPRFQGRATAQEQTLRQLQSIRTWSINDFRFTGVLGVGRASTVYRAMHVSTGMDLAIKKLTRSKIETTYEMQQVKNEIAVHSTLFHPAITSFYGSFTDEAGNIYIMLEYAKRGDVYSTLYNKAGVHLDDDENEDDAAAGTRLLSEADVCEVVIGPLVSAVAHLHARDIVHRDIKPENLMMSDDGLGCKLLDFGFAVNTRQHRTSTRLGTPEYMAPEILNSDFETRARARAEGRSTYGKEADCWAIGILAYECLVGHTPFNFAGQEESKSSLNDLMREIREVDFDPRSKRQRVSAGARNFILSCLTLDPKQRLTAEQMLWHPWITEMLVEANTRRTEVAARRRSRREASARAAGGSGSDVAPVPVVLTSLNVRPNSIGGTAGGSLRGDTPWEDKLEPPFGLALGNHGRAPRFGVTPSNQGMLIAGGFPSARYPTTKSMAPAGDFTDLTALRFGASPSAGDLGNFFNSLGGARTSSGGRRSPPANAASRQVSADEERKQHPPQQKKIKSGSFTGRMLRRFQKILSKISFDERS
jgi:serine/threonine protein kinase